MLILIMRCYNTRDDTSPTTFKNMFQGVTIVEVQYKGKRKILEVSHCISYRQLLVFMKYYNIMYAGADPGFSYGRGQSII